MRYAIYFMPAPDSALWSFGSSAIGYDAARGVDVAFPDHPAFARGDIAELTAEPRRYGFHATLKAPFELAAGASEQGLVAAARAFAAEREAFHLPCLAVTEVSRRFIALCEPETTPALQALAADCVRAFEPFRAPLSAADRARRLVKPLTPRQIENLDAWGYHLVFDDFRFHMTLTGVLDEVTRPLMQEALGALYAGVDPRPVAIDAIAIFRQTSRAERFHVLERVAFG